MGSNMAEAHPIAFRFAMQAKAKGATLIHADPRYTRTSAMCGLYAPVRAGTDIAFLGGVIRHILENDLWFRDYALNYTDIEGLGRLGSLAGQAVGTLSDFAQNPGSSAEDLLDGNPDLRQRMESVERRLQSSGTGSVEGSVSVPAGDCLG